MSLMEVENLVRRGSLKSVPSLVPVYPLQAFPLEIRPPLMPFDRMEQSAQWHKFRTNDPGLVWLRGMLAEASRHMDET